MARPNRLKEIEQEWGEPLDSLIPRKLNELGTKTAVAMELKTSVQTITSWVEENNYVLKGVWHKADQHLEVTIHDVA